MTDIAIHELPAANPLSGGESVPIDDGAATVRTTVADIRAGLAAQNHSHAINAIDPAFSTAGGVVAFSPGGGSEAFRIIPRVGQNDHRLGVSQGIDLGATDTNPILVADGSGAAVGIDFLAKGAGSFGFYTGSDGFSVGSVSEQLRIAHAEGANRCVIVAGGANIDPTLGATNGGRIDFAAVPALPSFTVATLPAATSRGVIFVSNGAGGRRLAVADGAQWLWPDGTIVS